MCLDVCARMAHGHRMDDALADLADDGGDWVDGALDAFEDAIFDALVDHDVFRVAELAVAACQVQVRCNLARAAEYPAADS